MSHLIFRIYFGERMLPCSKINRHKRIKMREFKELDIDTKQFPLHLHACLEHDKINFIVTRMKF